MDTTIPTDTTGTTGTTGTSTNGAGPIRTYFRRVNRLFLSPGSFFREDLPGFTLSEILTFSLVSAWLASVISFFLDTINSLLLTRLFEGWVQRLFVSEQGFSLLGTTSSSFVWSAGLLLLGPFLFLLRILFGSMALYFFSSLLIEENELAPEPVTFKGVMRIEAAAFTAYWFSVVPFFGSLIAFIANIVLLITGVRERFRVSTRRAAAVVLAPYFMIFLFSLLLLGVLVIAFFQIPFGEILNIDLSSIRELR